MDYDDSCFPKNTLESDEGIYSCSQGMFSCGEEPENNDQINIGDYELDTRSEEKFDIHDDDEFVFVRLYKSEYVNKLTPVAILDKGIRLVNHDDLRTNLIYNHCAINCKLTDDYRGLALDNSEFDLKIEKCTDSKSTSLISKTDINSSKFVVYCMKVSKSEYLSIKKFLKDCQQSKKLTYNVFKVPILAINNTVAKLKKEFEKIKFKMSKEDKRDDVIDVDNLKETFVCSTFVAFILYKFTKAGKRMDADNIKYGNCMPNTVATIPGMMYMFDGTFVDYNAKVSDFVSRYPQFKKYITKE